MAIDQSKQTARWRRNKEAERARNSSYPRRMPNELGELILRERDPRAAGNQIARFVIRPNHHFFEPGSYERAIRFAADIWAADIWLREQWGPKGAMPRRVAAWLDIHGAPHGYTEKSLPKMIRRARVRIKLLEQPLPWNQDAPVWAAFNPIETNH